MPTSESDTIPLYPARLRYWTGFLREGEVAPSNGMPCDRFFGRKRPHLEPDDCAHDGDEEFNYSPCDDMIAEMRRLLEQGGDRADGGV